jgi:hypothetical protein
MRNNQKPKFVSSQPNETIGNQKKQNSFSDTENEKLHSAWISGELVTDFDGGYLNMSDNSAIDVSRTKREDLSRKLLPSKE